MKSILVTGSRGFIGRALTKKLRAGAYEVYEHDIEEGDISDPDSLKRFDHTGISNVIHLAGKTFVPDSWEKPQQFYQINVMGTLNALEFCRRNNCVLTHVSAYLYGQPEILPVTENSNIQPNNPYAHSKFLAENLCKFYNKEFKTRVIIIRPFNVFGINQSKIFLIPTIIEQVLNNDSIRVNDLLPRRDYIFLEDLIQALIKTLYSEEIFGIFNIGSGSSLSVKEIIDEVQIIFNSNKPVISKNVIRTHEINDVYADISHAKKHLKWQPEYSFKQGIQEIYDSYLGNK